MQPETRDAEAALGELRTTLAKTTAGAMETGEGGGNADGEAEGKGENEKEEDSDFDANDIPDWTEEQTKRKEDLEEKIKDINLTKNINKSIDNFNSIKLKHKDKLTQEEMMYIDVALEELEELKQ